MGGYGQDLEANLRDLHERVQSGRYRAKPSGGCTSRRRTGGCGRWASPSLEDKIVQRAVVEVLNAVYEADFRGFSYGFRPGRGPHDALDALAVGIERKRVNWVLDADIRDFFGQLDHAWLRRFLEHRIADERVLRLIGKWLAAGVVEEGTMVGVRARVHRRGHRRRRCSRTCTCITSSTCGSTGGGVTTRDGDVIIVRFADDFIVGFQYEEDARRFLDELRERFARFGLELHPDKTRLIEFGRRAASNRQARGLGKPETFDFLGFTHICARARSGRFWVQRITIAKRMRAKLAEVKTQLKRRMHDPIPEQGRWLAQRAARARGLLRRAGQHPTRYRPSGTR